MPETFKTPIALIIFNRPDFTRKVFSVLRVLRPSHLFVIADGPRINYVSDIKACSEARAVLESIDWPCEVRKLYSEINLGCKNRISSGLNLVFECVEQAIILEDDCLPEKTFFDYCQILLNHYREDERIMAISGNNFQFGQDINEYSYYFSRYNHCWGWATWSRAWQKNDPTISLWPLAKQLRLLATILDSRREVRYWTKLFDLVYEGKIDTWDYAWTFACWMNSGLTILPRVNLVSNIGFGADATHTTEKSSLSNMSIQSMEFPLRHPPYVLPDQEADRRTDELMFSLTLRKRAFLKLKQLIKIS